MNSSNYYNFISWESGATPAATITDEAVYPFITGDSINFYINFYTPIDVDVSAWKIGIWLPAVGIVLGNIGTLNQDSVDGVNFNLYASLTLGVMPGPWFRLVLYEGTTVKYWSSPFTPRTVSTNTIVLKYRNSFNILNFEYENITTFYNKLRIMAKLGEPRVERESIGYDISSGLFVSAKSVLKISKNLAIFGLDENGHNAMGALPAHDEIYLDDIRYYAADQNYEPENITSEHYLWNGKIRLYKYEQTVIASNT